MTQAERSREPMLATSADRPSRLVDLIGIAVIGLAIQGLWALRLHAPTYMDAFYYANNGRRLAGGFGFTEQVIWQFLDNPSGFPTPSHTYWLPLPSILAAGGYRLWHSFWGEQFLFWLLGGLLPLLAYLISQQLSGQRWQAWAAALFTATGGFYAVYLSQPSTFAPFAWSSGLCLLLLGIVGRDWQPGNTVAPSRWSSRPWLLWSAAGLTAGLAHLTRADGVLLLLVGVLVWLKGYLTARGSRDPKGSPSRSFRYLLWFIIGYFVIMGAWFARNWLVIGRPLSTAGMQSVFLTTYDDLFAYGRSLGPGSYLSWGLGNILWSKAEAVWLAVQQFVAVNGLIFLTPFAVVGWLKLNRQPDRQPILQPATWYALVLFATLTLLFTFPGMRGSVFHSSIALWPWTMALAVAGIDAAVDWVAARRSHWQPERAKRNFSGLFVIVALLIAISVSRVRTTPGEDPLTFQKIGQMLPADSVVMVGNAPAFHYYTGLPSVSVPNEPVDIVLQAADQYGVDYLILNENRPEPLAELYSGQADHQRLRPLETDAGVTLYRIVRGVQ